MTATEKIAATGVLPVINIPDETRAVDLAKALMEGGLSAIEVTLRSQGSLEAIRRIHEALPEFSVGAGTVLNTELCRSALDAGAEFIVSPGFDEKLFDYCRNQGVPYVPGCSSATEIQYVAGLGLEIVKFFPAELSGGIEAIKLLSGPFPKLKFLPTGGITFANLESYLRSDKIIACGGSFMAPAKLIETGDFGTITENCRLALKLSLGFEQAHIGINHTDADSAVATADFIADTFMMTAKSGNSSIFVDRSVEAMKMPFYGTHGHIGFYTNSMERALAYFAKKGIAVNPESIRRDSKGLVSAYLADEAGGFALHVVRR